MTEWIDYYGYDRPEGWSIRRARHYRCFHLYPSQKDTPDNTWSYDNEDEVICHLVDQTRKALELAGSTKS